MGEDEHLPTSNQAVTGDDAIAHGLALGHVELGGAVGYEGVQLDETTGIEQAADPLPGGQFALAPLDSLRLAAPMHRVVATLAELVDQPLVGAGSTRRPPAGFGRPGSRALGALPRRARLGLGHVAIFADLPADGRFPTTPPSEIQNR